MDKVKPYTFWIVTGIILLAELIYFGLILTPTNPDKEGETVESAKESADRTFQRLQSKYHKKAKANLAAGDLIPKNPIHPENAADVKKKFLDTFLIHPEWEETFKQVVQDYRDQITAIKADLVKRTEPLALPVSEATDKADWYEDYLKETKALLKDMYATRKADFPQGTPGADGTLSVPTENDWEDNASFRDILGFKTTKSNFPDSSEWPTLTARFRVAQLLCNEVKDVVVVAPKNPRIEKVKDEEVKRPSAEAPRGVVLRDLTWERDSREGRGLPGASAALVQPFKLELRGTPAALLEFAARVEAMTAPIIVRTGAEWKRIPRSSGSLLGQDGEEMFLTMHLAYVDFSGVQ